MTAGSRIIAWGPDLEIGIPIIDLQHRRLVDLINQAGQALRSGHEEDVEVILNGLLAYAAGHFNQEEHLLERAGFPALAEHKEEHAAFRVEVAARYTAYLTRANGSSESLPDFLGRWLRDHVQGTDRKYVEHLKAYLANG